MSMHEKLKSKTWICRLYAGFFFGVSGWKRPAKESIEPLRLAHRIGLECGVLIIAKMQFIAGLSAHVVFLTTQVTLNVQC